jgi:hypothetical protein
MQERRAHSRVCFHRDVSLVVSREITYSCVAYDFCMCGIGIYTSEQLPAGQTISVEFQIMSDSSWRDINLRGRVAYSRQQGDHYNTGISFY